jgi:hypothetical protein
VHNLYDWNFHSCFSVNFFLKLSIYFFKYTQWQRILSNSNITAVYKPFTLARFEPGIFCSVGGRDDHYATPPGLECQLLLYIPKYIYITGSQPNFESKSFMKQLRLGLFFKAVVCKFHFEKTGFRLLNFCKKSWIPLCALRVTRWPNITYLLPQVHTYKSSPFCVNGANRNIFLMPTMYILNAYARNT